MSPSEPALPSHAEVSRPEVGHAAAVKIVAYQGNLYTEAGSALYRYFPLGELSHLGQTVPWAVNWEPYIQMWVATYLPLPRTTSETPAISRGGLSYQDRDGAAPGCSYQQAVYRGWPLYTCGLDTPGFQIPPQGTVPGLFEMVSVAEPPVVWPPEAGSPDDDGGGEGWPKYLSGP